MVTKYKWDKKLPDAVWWKCHQKSLAALNINDRIRIQKFIFNRLPTNRRAAMYSEHASDICNACNACKEEEETADHILKCSAPDRAALRE